MLGCVAGKASRRARRSSTWISSSSVARAAASSDGGPPSVDPSDDDDAAAAAALAAELAALVGKRSPGEMDAATKHARIVALLGRLESARAPFDPRAFEGAWEVRWSEGTMAWRALVARAVQAVAGRSRAGQCFTMGTLLGEPNEALNFAELFGGAVTITAWGFFRPKPAFATEDDPGRLREGARYPVGFDVQISGGDLQLGSRRWELPICGPGNFECLYGGEGVRVFRSSGGIAVQVPSDWRPPEPTVVEKLTAIRLSEERLCEGAFAKDPECEEQIAKRKSVGDRTD